MHWAHLRRCVTSGCHLQLLRSSGEFLDQLVCHRIEHVDPLDSEAGLSGIEETTDGDRLAGLFQVRVITNDGRTAATQLERDMFQVRGCLAPHLLTTLGFAREARPA